MAGGNCTFFAKGEAGYSLETAERNIQARLSFANDDGEAYGSMLAFPMSKKQYDDGRMDTAMSVTARILPWDTSGEAGHSFPGGKAGFNNYAALLGLKGIHYGEDIRASENMEYVSQGSVNNALCFLGPHRKYNPWSNSATELIPGQGHFGPDAVPGDARWRRGEVVSLKAAREHMQTYEAAAHAVMSFAK